MRFAKTVGLPPLFPDGCDLPSQRLLKRHIFPLAATLVLCVLTSITYLFFLDKRGISSQAKTIPGKLSFPGIVLIHGDLDHHLFQMGRSIQTAAGLMDIAGQRNAEHARL